MKIQTVIDVEQTSPEALSTLRSSLQSILTKTLTPPPNLKLSEWADTYRYLGFSSPEPGRWKTDRAPYQREMLDVAGDYKTQRIVIMAGAQLGKTSLLENVIGFYMVNDPSPMMLTMPSEEMAKSFGQTKLDPMLEESPILRELVASKRKRDGGNKLQEKVFPGGFVVLASAKSADSLRSRTVRVLLLDEVDAYENISEEGDPIRIAEARTSNWPNKKIIITSTPTVKGFSRVEAEYLRSDQRRFHVPCPLCSHYQVLKFGGREFPYGLKWGDDDPTKVVYQCESCLELFDESHKLGMMNKGEWRADNPISPIAGFHISSLYSPWVKWTDLVAEWLEVRGLPDKQQEFVNLRLGESWEDRSNTIEIHELGSRLGTYDAPCPTGVGLITAGVDVQGKWLEVGVWGFGENDEMWMLDNLQITGDTTQPEVWNELGTFLKNTYKTVNGGTVGIRVAAIDVGYQQTTIEEHIKRLRGQVGGVTLVPVKGFDNQRETFQFQQNETRARHRLGKVGVSNVKDILLSRLKQVTVPGPGYLHFPAGVNEEVLNQILAERKVTAYHKGKAPTAHWKKLRDRNEQLDCMVYAYAVRYSLTNRNLNEYISAKVKELSGTAVQKPVSSSSEGQNISQIQRDTIKRETLIAPTRRLGRGLW